MFSFLFAVSAAIASVAAFALQDVSLHSFQPKLPRPSSHAMDNLHVGLLLRANIGPILPVCAPSSARKPAGA